MELLPLTQFSQVAWYRTIILWLPAWYLLKRLQPSSLDRHWLQRWPHCVLLTTPCILIVKSFSRSFLRQIIGNVVLSFLSEDDFPFFCGDYRHHWSCNYHFLSVNLWGSDTFATAHFESEAEKQWASFISALHCEWFTTPGGSQSK